MTNSFFSKVPDFDYINRTDDGKSDGDIILIAPEDKTKIGNRVH